MARWRFSCKCLMPQTPVTDPVQHLGSLVAPQGHLSSPQSCHPGMGMRWQGHGSRHRLWLQAWCPSSAALPAARRSTGFPEGNHTFKTPNFYFLLFGWFCLFLKKIKSQMRSVPSKMMRSLRALQNSPCCGGEAAWSCLSQPPLSDMRPSRNLNIAFKYRLGKISAVWVGLMNDLFTQQTLKYGLTLVRYILV